MKKTIYLILIMFALNSGCKNYQEYESYYNNYIFSYSNEFKKMYLLSLDSNYIQLRNTKTKSDSYKIKLLLFKNQLVIEERIGNMSYIHNIAKDSNYIFKNYEDFIFSGSINVIGVDLDSNYIYLRFTNSFYFTTIFIDKKSCLPTYIEEKCNLYNNINVTYNIFYLRHNNFKLHDIINNKQW